MAKDNFYIFDKKTHKRSLLGEIQSGFNMSATIDGTKDSLSCIVWAFIESEIEPYTICWHAKNNTWWVVSHDKVERYQNDDGDFIYVHNLELLGAIELLNARDLTDCAFNDNLYTVRQFIDKLFKLSNYEYSVAYSSQINVAQKVEFIKTFENYTLLSAIKEFLDAYNCSAKLSFNTTEIPYLNDVYISGSVLTIISKTGDISLTTHTMNNFDDIRETKTMSKESFGACVISNAENVISSTSKTYPSVGGVRASSKEYTIKAENAIIRLPSKVFSANWLKLITSRAFVECSGSVGSTPISFSSNALSINPLNKQSFDSAINDILEAIFSADYAEYNNTPQGAGVFYNPCREALLAAKDNILSKILLASTITLYNGNEMNPINGSIIKGPNVPYIVKVDYYSKGDDDEPLLFCDKDMKSTLTKTWTGICWERGSNEISGFDGFEPEQGRNATIVIRNLNYTDLQVNAALVSHNGGSGNTTYDFFYFSNEYGELYIRTPQSGSYNIHFRDNAQWIVNYIPMSDIKLKVDNARDKNDVQLYNQNGKLIDNLALSKLINSYSKEISSDTITKFMYYTNISQIPQVGSLVITDDGEYVINNISYTFTQNESNTPTTDFDYFIECEFTMSKYVSTKSLMVNPNTNIRDYGIPQNFNVKRKQVYRDFYELNYTLNSDNESDYYLIPSLVFNFSHYPSEVVDYTCVIKIDYAYNVNGEPTWYYQLNTTKYDFNKMFYIVLDFQDNNIIGYCNQNVWSGFVISRIFSGLYDNVNIPISYTDEYGGFKNISVIYLTSNQLMKDYEDYLDASSGESNYSSFVSSGKTLYNASVFIPAYIYANAINDYTFKIEEENYEKDPLEVPVFEYGCQVDDTPEVLIGDNIFEEEKDCIYFYSYVVGDNLNQYNATNNEVVQYNSSTGVYNIEYSPVITLDGVNININLYRNVQYLEDFDSWNNVLQLNFEQGKDYAVFRHRYNIAKQQETISLLFIAKRVPVSGNTLTLKINHYKLK